MKYLAQTSEKNFLIRLMKEDDILLSLQDFCKEHQEIGAGRISGIGAVSCAVLGFYDGHQYIKNTFQEPLEILSLLGNVAKSQIVHLHGIFGRKDGSCIGGHIFPGCTVSFTCEIHLTILLPGVERVKDIETNLVLLNLPNQL
ncbi:MAG: PPC domain-containing DNA-binding protein [Candidatus Hodarchaeales archaeon]